MKFFQNCTTLEEVKSLYKKLAFENHPDKGGDTETMQTINAEYAFASARMLKGANLSDEQTEQQIKFSEEYRRIIEQIAHLPVTIELVGLWIWVTGNTYPLRKQLKTAGLFFASKKQAWYYRSEDLKELRGSKKTLDEIRSKYGSELVNNNTNYRPALQ